MLQRVKAERHPANKTGRPGWPSRSQELPRSWQRGCGGLERDGAGQLVKAQLRELQSFVVIGPQVRQRIVAEQRDLVDTGAYIILRSQDAVQTRGPRGAEVNEEKILRHVDELAHSTFAALYCDRFDASRKVHSAPGAGGIFIAGLQRGLSARLPQRTNVHRVGSGAIAVRV